MEAQFKIIWYLCSRDYHFKKNGIVITDLETLLKFVNKCRYYTVNGTEVQPSEKWDYFIKKYEEHQVFIDIIENTNNTSVRIIGTDVLCSFPQKTNNVLYDSIEDPRLSSISKNSINYYPYTISEFLYLLSTDQEKLNLLNYDYIAIANH